MPNHFTNLEAWQCAHDLTVEIYQITTVYPKHELFHIVSQLRRASSSITANLAEGWGRHYYKDKIRFYYQARASGYEVQNFIYLSVSLGYMTDEKSKDLIRKSILILKLCNGLISSLREKAYPNT